jgi:DNA-directed RNA polymerase subunit RPC12/RpoP
MTSPPERLEVQCPGCGNVYETWYRRSINLTLGEEWTKEEIQAATTGSCPACGRRVNLSSLVVREDGLWTLHLP